MFSFHLPSPKALSLFLLSNILIILYLFNRNSRRSLTIEHQTQDLQEKINLLNNSNSQEVKNKQALEEKINRYHRLKEIIEKLNQDLSLEVIGEALVWLVSSAISGDKGTTILYLLDPKTRLTLNLFKVRKDDPELVIKAKEGDIFDAWVLRHSSPLLVEDIKKDFRFDLEKLKSHEQARPIASLVSSPLISEHKFLGILRLDSQIRSFYSQDDLRFLMTISDLGAVALENGLLFHQTQDLAIHDELTSFYTKGYFLDRLKEECTRARRQEGALALLMLDIDNFKDYNDRFGHTAGDMVLKKLSEVILSTLGPLSPVISRFGGEEFCIALPCLSKDKASSAAEGLRAKISQTKIILRRSQTAVTVSIGIAAFPSSTYDENELIIMADRAMYEAKLKGRNQVVIC